MQRIIIILSQFLLISIFTIFSSCSKSKKTTTTIDINQQWHFDIVGNVIQKFSDGQWQAKDFSPEELALFESLNSVDLTGTVTPPLGIDTSGHNHIFPNPFGDINQLILQFNDTPSAAIVLKVVIVDSHMVPVYKMSERLDSSFQNCFVSLSPDIPAGRYRLYFTLNSEANPHFYKSWGNIEKSW